MREGDTVNVFDRAVAAVAPVHAAKRAAARAALKDYAAEKSESAE